jgi:hypothetical protein
MKGRRVFLAAFAGLSVMSAGFGQAAAQPDPAVDPRQAICRIVDEVAEANRLPASFLARVLWHESRLQTDAVSRAGAEGIAQFMPTTAAERGLADPRAAIPSIVQAGRFLAELRARFGNLGLAAAGYNAGPGRVAKWLQAQSELPSETRRYVLAVTGHPAEDWIDRGGSRHPEGIDGRPCLGVTAELAQSTSGRAGASAWRAGLDRVLARASALAAAAPRPRPLQRDPPAAAETLCHTIRFLGARCTVDER